MAKTSFFYFQTPPKEDRSKDAGYCILLESLFGSLCKVYEYTTMGNIHQIAAPSILMKG
jgi:hypothetical protein